MLTQRNIATNTAFFITALTIQKALSFIYFSYLARSLGTGLTGKYFFALSIGGIVAGIMDLGLTPVLIREVSKEKKDAADFVSHIMGFKLIVASVIVILSILLLPILIPEALVRQLVYIAFGIALLDSFALTFFAAVRAHQNLLYESMSSILFQVIVVILGGYAIYQHYDLRVIIMALFTASLINLLFAMTVVKRKIGIRIRPAFNFTFVKKLIKYAIPFALAVLFIKIYAYIDTVMLRYMVGDEAVGIYSVAYKITFAFQFIPMAFVAALYPAFSYYFKHDAERLKSAFIGSIKYLLIISLPISFGIIALAPEMIPHIYTGAYRGSVVPLCILIASLPFLFINFPVGSLLNACSRQTRQTIHLGITMVVNIILNILLIPVLKVTGASLASTLSTLFIFLLGIYVSYRIARVRVSELVAVFLKLFAISAGMFFLAYAMKQFIPWYMVIIPSGIVYAVALYAFRIVTRGDMVYMRSMLRR